MKYIIPKGWHYSLHVPKPYLGVKKEFEFEVSFDENCRYDLQGPDQSDINKEFGVGFGLWPGSHLQNSIRVGSNYDLSTGMMNIHWYIHEGGKRDYGFITRVNIGKQNITQGKLILGENYFTIDVGQDHIMKKYVYPKSRIGWYLFPYFGGDKVATHCMTMYLWVKNKFWLF